MGKLKRVAEIASFSIPRLAPGGIIKHICGPIFEGIDNKKDLEYPFKLKTISKKRFIKLLMSKGYQRNQAKEMQEQYIKKHTNYNHLGLIIFENIYRNPEIGEIKVFLGGKEIGTNKI